jgi:hypothetical protein
MEKPGQSRQAKLGEKGEKGKKINCFYFCLFYFFSKDACPSDTFYPVQKCLMSLKLIVFQYNSFIQTSKISKNHFFPSVKLPGEAKHLPNVDNRLTGMI